MYFIAMLLLNIDVARTLAVERASELASYNWSSGDECPLRLALLMHRFKAANEGRFTCSESDANARRSPTTAAPKPCFKDDGVGPIAIKSD
jgi:hypothetical protein